MEANRAAHRRDQRAARRGRRATVSASIRRRSSPRRPTTSTDTRSKTQRTANPEGVGEQQKEIEAEAQRLRELNLEVQKVEAERAALQAELGKYTSEVGRLQKEIDQINFEQNRLQRVVANIEPSFVKDYFRNAPLLDFMAPTLTVRQVVTPNVVDDVNFARVTKMDRCTTCHLAIDRRGYEKYPQPFRTHPNLRPTSAATRRIRWRRPAARCAIRDSADRPASTTRRTIRATRSSGRSGKRSTTGTSRTCGTTRCCRRT